MQFLAPIKAKIATVIVGIAVSLGLISAPVTTTPPPTAPQQQQTGASLTIPSVVASLETSLASPITAAATTMTLLKGTDDNGTTLSGYYCFTLDEGTTRQEYVCGTASSTSVTGMLRGLDPSNPGTEVTALKVSHRLGASVKITDYPVLGIITRIVNGQDTFPNVLQYATSVTNAAIGANAWNLASVGFVASTSYSGTVDATEAIKGVVEAATQAEMSAGTATGTTGALLFLPAQRANSTSSATTTIPITMTNGQLSPGFISTSSQYTWTGTSSFSNVASMVIATATSTATSTDNFNLLPAGVIQMWGASATTTAPSGWLLANGTEYATSSYPRLFQVIGYTYGGSTSTFKVPNFKHAGPLGLDTATASTTSMGQTGGELTHTLTTNEMPAHTHSYPNDAGAGAGGSGNAVAYTGGQGGAHSTASAGGDAAHNVLDPYVVVQFIIKY